MIAPIGVKYVNVLLVRIASIMTTSPTKTIPLVKERKMDSVNHPSHYNSGRIEVIEALEDWKLNFHRSNAIKYVARAGKKDPSKEIEDLQKAVWYLNRDIHLLECTRQNRIPVKPNDMPVMDPLPRIKGTSIVDEHAKFEKEIAKLKGPK